MIILTQQYKLGVSRSKINKQHKEYIQKFWEKSCRKSTTQTICIQKKPELYVPILWQQRSTIDIWKSYVNEPLELNWKYVCYETFKSLKPKQVKTQRKYTGLCCHCQTGIQTLNMLKISHQQFHTHYLSECSCASSLESIVIQEHYQKILQCQNYLNFMNSDLIRKSKLDKWMIEINEYEKHKCLFTYQDQQFMKNIESLKSDECIIIQDFAAKYFVQDSIYESQRTWFKKSTCNNLVITLIYFNENGKQMKYYDFFSSDQYHDHLYVISVWKNYLLVNEELKKFKRIYIWSDG